MTPVVAKLIRDEAGVKVGQPFAIGNEYELDLDNIRSVFIPSFGMVWVIFFPDGIGAIPVECLEFPDDVVIPLIDPPADEWANTLDPDSLDKMQAARKAAEASYDPFSSLGGIESISKFLRKFKTEVRDIFQPSPRPRMIKLISALDVARLETAVNEFLASGADIAFVSTRIYRQGNELSKEVHYYVKPKIVSEEEIYNKELDIKGKRFTLDNGDFVDAWNTTDTTDDVVGKIADELSTTDENGEAGSDGE